jgi:hypothetical protein
MKATSLVFVVLLPSAVLAGKEERDFLKKEVAPVVKQAEEAYAKSCGCPLKIEVKSDSLKTTDDLIRAKYIAESIRDGVASQCEDEEGKKVLCRMKSLEINKGKDRVFTFVEPKGTATTDGQSYVPLKMMLEQLEK